VEAGSRTDFFSEEGGTLVGRYTKVKDDKEKGGGSLSKRGEFSKEGRKDLLAYVGELINWRRGDCPSEKPGGASFPKKSVKLLP